MAAGIQTCAIINSSRRRSTGRDLCGNSAYDADLYENWRTGGTGLQAVDSFVSEGTRGKGILPNWPIMTNHAAEAGADVDLGVQNDNFAPSRESLAGVLGPDAFGVSGLPLDLIVQTPAARPGCVLLGEPSQLSRLSARLLHRDGGRAPLSTGVQPADGSTSSVRGENTGRLPYLMESRHALRGSPYVATKGESDGSCLCTCFLRSIPDHACRFFPPSLIYWGPARSKRL